MSEDPSVAHLARFQASLANRPIDGAKGTVIGGGTWLARNELGAVIVDKQRRPCWLKFPLELERLIQYVPEGMVSSYSPNLRQAYNALVKLSTDEEWGATAEAAMIELERAVAPNPDPPPVVIPAVVPPWYPVPPDLWFRVPSWIMVLVDDLGVYRTVLALRSAADEADTQHSHDEYLTLAGVLESESLEWAAQAG